MFKNVWGILLNWYYYAVVAGFGLIFGSFFNVCIYRIPRSESLGSRSACPHCGEPVKWYDNIPLASFIVLGGKCRDCRAAISWRYPAVEASTALLFCLMYWWSIAMVPGELMVAESDIFVPEFLIGLLLVSVIVVAVGTDLTFGIVPNKATVPGMLAMLVVVAGLALYRGQPGRIALSLASAGIGAGFLMAAGLLYGLVFMRSDPNEGTGREEEPGDDVEKQADRGTVLSGWGDKIEDEEEDLPTGIGMGDVKLMVVVGLALGYFHWYLVLIQVFLGYMIGAVAAVLLMCFAGLRRKDRLPFVPFLAVAAVVTLVWGQAIVEFYLRLFR